MHSRKHRRERQRIAANKFRIRNGRRKQPTYRIDYRSPRRTWHWYVQLCIAIRIAKTERQAEKITLGIICEGIHRTRLPCGNHAATGNPVTVRIAPRKSP